MKKIHGLKSQDAVELAVRRIFNRDIFSIRIDEISLFSWFIFCIYFFLFLFILLSVLPFYDNLKANERERMKRNFEHESTFAFPKD